MQKAHSATGRCLLARFPGRGRKLAIIRSGRKIVYLLIHCAGRKKERYADQWRSSSGDSEKSHRYETK